MSEVLKQFRAQYPMYDDMPDDMLAANIHKTFYADMSADDFNAKLFGSKESTLQDIGAAAGTAPIKLAQVVAGIPAGVSDAVTWAANKAANGLGLAPTNYTGRDNPIVAGSRALSDGLGKLADAVGEELHTDEFNRKAKAESARPDKGTIGGLWDAATSGDMDLLKKQANANWEDVKDAAAFYGNNPLHGFAAGVESAPMMLAPMAAAKMAGGAGLSATKAAIATGAAMEGASAASGTRMRIDDMSVDDLSLVSPEFNNLLMQGMAPETAKSELARLAGGEAFTISTIASGIASKLTGAGKFEADVGTGGVGGVFKGGLRGGATEFPQEFVESGAGQYAENQAIKDFANSEQNLSQGVLKGATQGGIVGMGTGATVGAARGLFGSNPMPTEQPDNRPDVTGKDGTDLIGNQGNSPVIDTHLKRTQDELKAFEQQETEALNAGLAQAVQNAQAASVQNQQAAVQPPAPLVPQDPELQAMAAQGVPVVEITPPVQEQSQPKTKPEPVTPFDEVSEDSQAPEQNGFKGLPIQELPVDKLTLSNDVPQFKDGANESGVVESLGGKFDRTGVAPIQVWQRNDGRMEVISGRHRLDLARRSGESTIPVQVHREADGFDADKASTLDAELNIRDGQGKVADYVQYFTKSGIDKETANNRGLLSRAIGKRAYAIATSGETELVAAHRANVTTDLGAYTIATAFPNDGKRQQVALARLQQGDNVEKAINVARALSAITGGDSNMDMFGFDDAAIKEAERMAKEAVAIQRQITNDIAAVQGAAKNPKAAAKFGVNVSDPDGVKKRIESLKEERSQWDNWHTNPALVAQLRGEEVQAVEPIAQAQPSTAQDDFLTSYDESTIQSQEANAKALAQQQAAQQNKEAIDAGVDNFSLDMGNVPDDDGGATFDMFSAPEPAAQSKPTQAPAVVEAVTQTYDTIADTQEIVPSKSGEPFKTIAAAKLSATFKNAPNAEVKQVGEKQFVVVKPKQVQVAEVEQAQPLSKYGALVGRKDVGKKLTEYGAHNAYEDAELRPLLDDVEQIYADFKRDGKYPYTDAVNEEAVNRGLISQEELDAPSKQGDYSAASSASQLIYSASKTIDFFAGQKKNQEAKGKLSKLIGYNFGQVQASDGQKPIKLSAFTLTSIDENGNAVVSAASGNKKVSLVFSPSSIEHVVTQSESQGLKTRNPFKNITLNDQAQPEAKQEASESIEQPAQAVEMQTQSVAQEATKPQERIDDVGESMAGAKKMTFKFADALAADVDIASVPLSKSFPKPDYVAMAKAGADHEVLSLVAMLRDEIPAKPKVAYRLKSWVSKVESAREIASQLMENATNGTLSLQRVYEVFAGADKILKPLVDVALLASNVKPEQIETLSQYRLRTVQGKVNKSVMPDYDAAILADDTEDNGLVKGTFFQVENVNNNRERAYFLNYANAQQYILDAVQAKSESTSGEKRVDFGVFSMRGQKGYQIGKKVSSGKFITLETGIASIAEAKAMIANDYDRLKAKYDAIKDIPSERKAINNPRIGEDYRNGHDVTAAEFAETFGFRGVQFGNYVDQGKRQEDLNNAYDGFMDLAGIIGVPPKALSLNGELGMAFGARGSGGKNPAKAHYEPDIVVINMTKANGSGSLAHEWFHALDNYFARLDNEKGKMDFASEKANPMARPEVMEAWKNLRLTIKNETQLFERSIALDSGRSKDYWSTVLEMVARSFERYVIDKLAEKGFESDYLANIIDAKDWDALQEVYASMGIDKKPYPYPLDAEAEKTNAAYDALFDAIETKVVGDKVVMFSFAGAKAKTANLENLATAQQALADGMNRDEVRQRTGWYQDEADKQWKWEIDDSGARFLPFVRKQTGLWTENLEDVIDHPELFNAYPTLKGVQVSTVNGLGSARGNWDAANNTVNLDSKLDYTEMYSTLMHEIQHAIQQEENFARGGSRDDFEFEAALNSNRVKNAITVIDEMRKQVFERRPDLQELEWQLDNGEYDGEGKEGYDKFNSEFDAMVDDIRTEKTSLVVKYSTAMNTLANIDKRDAYSMYKALSGEVEARNTQTRLTMDAQARKLTAPWETQDVPSDKQIVRFDGGRAEMAYPDMPVLATITGDEVSPADVDGLKKYFKDVLAIYGLDNPVVRDDGRKIAITMGTSFRKMKHGVPKNPNKARMVAAVLPVLKSGEFLENKESNKKDGESFDYIVGNIRVGNEVVGIKIHVKKEVNGDFAYHLNLDEEFGWDALEFGKLPSHTQNPSSKNTTTTNLTKQQAIDIVNKNSNGKRLLKNGKLVVLDSFEDAPQSAKDEFLLSGGENAPQGFFDPATDTTYLVADALTKNTIIGVMTHEVGGHAWWRNADKATREALGKRAAKLIEHGIEFGNDRLKAFYNGVQRRLVKAKVVGNNEEAFAYLAEEAINEAKAWRYALSDSRFIDAIANVSTRLANLMSDAIAYLKSSMHRLGWLDTDKLTGADLVAIAKRNMREVAQNDVGDNVGILAGNVAGNYAGVLASMASDTPTQAEIAQAQRDTDAQLAIADKVIADNGYLTAPNGEKSNLNRLQWAQVRTPQFKAWFGDWEGSSIVNGNSIVDLKTEDAPQGGFKDVEAWAENVFNQQGGKAVRVGFGEVALDKRSAKSSLAHGGANLYKKTAFLAVKDVIERGALIHSESNGVEDSFYFSAPVTIDGVVNIETVLVHRDVNTNRMYLHSVSTKESLKSQRVSSADDKSSKHSGSINSKGIASVLNSLLNGNGISKVVDANGEPLVVYHGTGADFDTFEKSTILKGNAYGDGFYFTAYSGDSMVYGKNRIDAYLNIKNPLNISKNDAAYFNFRDISQAHDGVVSDGLFVAHNPNQIKSAIGNVGTFSGKTGKVNFSKAGKAKSAPANTGKSYEAKMGDDVRIDYQDDMLAFKRVQETLEKKTGNKVPDVYEAVFTFKNKAAAGVDAINAKVNKALEAMSKLGVTPDVMGLYLYAKGAKDRNAMIEARNGVKNGSGMSDARADRLLADLQQTYQNIDSLTAAWYDIIDGSVLRAEQTGLLTDGWLNENRKAQPFYVPMKHDIKEGGELTAIEEQTGIRAMTDFSQGIGKAFNLTGKEIKKANGRISEAGDILTHIVADAQRLTIRAEKNVVGSTLAKLATQHKDDKLWVVKKEAPSNEGKGVKDGYVGVKVKGNQYYIVMRDERLAKAAAGINSQDFMWLDHLNQFIKKSITAWNPVFTIVNSARDTETAYINATGILGSKGANQMIAYGKGAMKSIWEFERNSEFENPNSEWSQWMQLYLDAGGKTGFRDFRSIIEVKENLDNQFDKTLGVMERIQRGVTAKEKAGDLLKISMNGIKNTAKWLEDLGAVTENVWRVAAFRVAIEQGKSAQEAAKIARELTVNFNRKGHNARGVERLFLFYNAAIQGTHNLASRAAKDPLYFFGKVGGSLLLLGVTAAMMGGDDDEWANIPEETKMRGIPFHVAGQRFVIPMAYGFGLIPYAGMKMVEMAKYEQSKGKYGVSVEQGMRQLVNATMLHFNPFGGQQMTDAISGEGSSALQWITPTVGDPLVQIYENTNVFGKRLRPESLNQDDTRPDSEKVFDHQRGTWYDNMAKGLNTVTGGNNVEAGVISVAPSSIKAWADLLAGGWGREIGRVITLAGKSFDDTETIKAADIPVLSVVWKQPTDADIYHRYSESTKALNEVKSTMTNYIKAGDTADAVERKKFMSAHKEQLSLLLTPKAKDDVSKYLYSNGFTGEQFNTAYYLMVKAHDDKKDELKKATSLALTATDNAKMKAVAERDRLRSELASQRKFIVESIRNAQYLDGNNNN